METAGWMEALVDRVHKQGEHIPQHRYISHNHPYISSSDMLGGTISISTATYVGMVVKCSDVVECPAIPTFGRFILETF